ncbi:hypothetical protein LSH36_187g07033 [Paralvinella palmiformis]|uniref:Endonuclease/exonuclease/phosphatase domain-containing protein n=1 Tax=Paralvinella palmiformis TaxID=53620 RepID=A0AAD9JS88_9ANNE|nr:hypothetical protein LSH36_187g07033 [Paralvinella palmiformis]
MPDITYKIIDIDNERVSGIQLISKGQVLMNIIGVYLPFYDESVDQIELYAESLQCLQSVLELHQGEPLVIVGDMNAALPQKQQLSFNWHQLRPFNADSLILYDFVCDNDMCIGNFGYTQTMNYMYFKGVNRTYIIHVFIPRYLMYMYYFRLST